MTRRPATLPDLVERRRLRDVLAGGDVVDVLVVGGGVTGAGVALDAASRGLSVALVEAHDLAFGTSRWSSKLVHGGLRYLAHGQVGVAYESARERHVLLTRTAPHLVRPMPFLVPFTGDVPARVAALTAAGLLAGDALRVAAGTPGRDLPRARRVTATEARHLVSTLGPVSGGLLHWDGLLEDDARLVLAVARTAAAHGARVLTYCRATSLDGGGAQVVDELEGGSFRLRARQVVVAAGVWSSELVPSVLLRPSRGSHLLVRGPAFGSLRSGLTVLVPGTANRWVFAVPRPDGDVLVGLTDEPVSGAVPDVPAVPVADEEFLLDTLNRALGRPLTPADVVGRFAGLRPLLAGTARGRTADLSRRHALLTDPGTGVHTVVGGKLTTYRRMAQDAVDLVVRRLGLRRACRTARLPLVGAAPRPVLDRAGPERLVRRYGAEAADVRALADGRPDLLAPVVDGAPVLGVELLWAVQREGALCVDDLLDRRTRLGLVPQRRAAAAPYAQAVLDGRAAVPH